MNFILDTNILIYSLCNPSELSAEAKRIVTTEPNLYISIISFWEIAIKQALGKLTIKSTIPQIESICHSRKIKILPISSDEIEGIKALPQIHKDPFDRLIISQARKNNLSIVTSDETIPKYNVQTIW